MKVTELLEQRARRPGNRDIDYLEISASFEDPRTGEEIEPTFIVKLSYDDGNVGFGVGHGKSPYMPDWEAVAVEVSNTFVLDGKRYEDGTDVDPSMFDKYTNNPDWFEDAIKYAKDRAKNINK